MAFDLCRSLLQAERTLPYREVNKSAEGLGLTVSKRMFANVQRELAGTVRLVTDPKHPDLPSKAPALILTGPRAVPAEPLTASASPDPGFEEDSKKNASRSPAVAFMVDHLGCDPDATYQQVRRAATMAGHEVFPITYGLARKLAGLPKQSKRTAASRSRNHQQGTRRKRAQPKTRIESPEHAIQSVLARIQELEQMIDELRTRLDAIKQTARSALSR